jgi:hypothetical protein
MENVTAALPFHYHFVESPQVQVLQGTQLYVQRNVAVLSSCTIS